MRKYITIYLVAFVFTLFTSCSEEQAIVSPIIEDDNVITQITEEVLTVDQDFQALVSLLNSANKFKANHLEFTENLIDLIEELDSRYLASTSEEQEQLFISILEKSLTINLVKESSVDAYVLNASKYGYQEINFGNMEYVKAPIGKVWATLVDDNLYENWNSFNQKMNTMFSDHSFVELKNQTEISWSTNVVSDFWFKSDRKIALETVGENNMVLSNEMKYTGILASFYYYLTNDSVLNDFDNLTDGLKTKVEA